MRRILTFCMLAGLTGLAMLATAGPALAHEERTVGPYHLAVGFGDEPAYAGFENSVQMLLHDANDKPVTDLGDTLKVDVIYGSQSTALTMAPFFEVGEFGTPGDYRAFFIPTRPGDYTFHFTGTIKKTNVDERFTSSPTTFSAVVDPTEVEFPVKDPSSGEVAQRLGREVPRLEAQISAAEASAKKAATTARTVAIVGLAVGAVGLILAVVAWRRKRTA